jgi:hemerythrin HHE cation binding domain-containing protein
LTLDELLRAQHEEIKDSFRRARALGSIPGRLRARDELATFLRAHTAVEEEQLYPKLEGLEETADWADVSYRAHELIREVLLELDACSPDDIEYAGIVDELEEIVEEHVGFEERRILGWVAGAWPEDRRAQLGAEMAARFEELRTSGARPVVEIDRDQLPEA